jgi:thiol-disulfide isomerase/thioredoxin
MRFLIIFIFLISSSYAKEISELKNIVINKELKKYDDLTFLDVKNREINLNDYKNHLIILNFWATWCTPCKKEMPSLDYLLTLKELDNLKIFPINVGKDSVEKSSAFFNELKIQNLRIYLDSPYTLAKKFELRGIPTSIIFNKDGEEFARIIGSIDFKDKNFIEWLSNFN